MTEQQEQQKHPGGRPRLEFDLRLVEDLGKIQSTHSELAAVLNVSIDTVERRLKDDSEFCGAYEKGLENGKSSLRRIQWKAALGGNTTMQIWLGKQYLSQRDMHSAELTGAKGEPLIPAQMVTGLDDATRTLLRTAGPVTADEWRKECASRACRAGCAAHVCARSGWASSGS